MYYKLFIENLGMFGFDTLYEMCKCMSRMIVGLVKIDQPITANKGAVLGAKFAMQFAAICGLSTQVAVA